MKTKALSCTTKGGLLSPLRFYFQISHRDRVFVRRACGTFFLSRWMPRVNDFYTEIISCRLVFGSLKTSAGLETNQFPWNILRNSAQTRLRDRKKTEEGKMIIFVRTRDLGSFALINRQSFRALFLFFPSPALLLPERVPPKPCRRQVHRSLVLRRASEQGFSQSRLSVVANSAHKRKRDSKSGRGEAQPTSESLNPFTLNAKLRLFHSPTWFMGKSITLKGFHYFKLLSQPKSKHKAIREEKESFPLILNFK